MVRFFLVAQMIAIEMGIVMDAPDSRDRALPIKNAQLESAWMEFDFATP